MCQRNAVGAQTGQPALSGCPDHGRQGRHRRRHHRRGLPGVAGGRDRWPPGCTRAGTARCSISCSGHGRLLPAMRPQRCGCIPGSAGSRPASELIDRYDLACLPVRDLLVDYLGERQPSSDYSTLQRLAYPRQAVLERPRGAPSRHRTLQLAPDVAVAWKQRVMTRTRRPATQAGTAADRGVSPPGRPHVLTAVRSFYLDIAEWADDDPPAGCPGRCPARSAPARSPTSKAGRGASRGWTSGPGNACRCCPPWSAVDQRRTNATAAGCRRPAAPPPGALFTAGGHTLRRSVMTKPRRPAGPGPRTRHRQTPRPHPRRAPRVLGLGRGRGPARHRGIRIEELTELSHHSLVQYRLPGTGELIPLLQIAPSKTDERTAPTR